MPVETGRRHHGTAVCEQPGVGGQTVQRLMVGANRPSGDFMARVPIGFWVSSDWLRLGRKNGEKR